MDTNDTIHTNAGVYTVAATLGEQTYTDDAHNLAVGRHTDGHYDFLVEDNASVWVLGNEDDADDNRAAFAAVGGGKEGDSPEAEQAAVDAGVAAVRAHLDEIRAIDGDLADWIADRAHEAANRRWRQYEVWLVPQGRGFDQGYTQGCTCLGICDTLDEAREVVGRAADETFREDGGEYDRIFDECAKAHPEQEPEGFSDPEVECKKFVEAAERDLCFDAGDLKTVRVREVIANESGAASKFVRVL